MDIEDTQQVAVTSASEAEAMTPRARKAIWGAFVAFFVDNYDIFLPVIALAPAMAYFMSSGMSATTVAIINGAIFASTLIARPLGALIFGHYADKIGRKNTTIISVAGFGAFSIFMAILPGYQSWGIAAVSVLIFLRFVDGIFVGGAYTAANPLAMEYCPKEKRGFYGAFIQSAASLGTGAISLVTLLVLLVVPAGGLDSPYVQWGWRIPFFIGAAMAFALVIYYYRSVDESELWRESSHTEAPLRNLFSGDNLWSFLQVFVFMTGFWLSLNATLALLPTFLTSRLGVTGNTSTLALLIAYVVLAIVYITGGVVSQRIGRRNYLMLASAVSAVAGTFFYYMLISTSPQSLLPVTVLTTLVIVLVTAPGALSTVYINERFQTNVRASGFGLGYSLAIILPSFYAFYQAGLSSIMPSDYTVLVLVVVGAGLIFAGAAWGPETKDVDFTPKNAPDG